MTSTANGTSRPLRFAIAFELGLGLAAVIAARLADIPLKAQLQVDAAGLGWGVAATVPMLIGFGWMVRSNWQPFIRLRWLARSLVGQLFPRATVMQLAILSLAAGIGEELLFRGLLQSAISDWTTPWVGLVAASLIFGGAHFLSALYFLLATVVGLYLGGLAIATDGLVAPIVAHAVYDFVALIFLLRLHPGESHV